MRTMLPTVLVRTIVKLLASVDTIDHETLRGNQCQSNRQFGDNSRLGTAIGPTLGRTGLSDRVRERGGSEGKDEDGSGTHYGKRKGW